MHGVDLQRILIKQHHAEVGSMTGNDERLSPLGHAVPIRIEDLHKFRFARVPILSGHRRQSAAIQRIIHVQAMPTLSEFDGRFRQIGSSGGAIHWG